MASTASSQAGRNRKLNIVVEGCCHGELPKIYESVKRMEQVHGIKVDLLICCGDFQCLRNTQDFHGLACPDKYKTLVSTSPDNAIDAFVSWIEEGVFHKYYSGELVAPVLTVFIGGNHEASSYLQELHYGGWVAPKIYFMGFAGVIRVGGVRIAGLTGIFNARSYKTGRHERPPYTKDTLRSVYYVRELEVFKLAQLTGHVDLFLSHDWPRGIARYGDTQALLRIKPFFREEVENNSLGSPAAEQLLHRIQPDFWFSAHLHVKFPAVVRHGEPREGQGIPDSELRGITRFLSLDKCLPRRDFMQLVSVDRPDGEGGEGDEVLVEYDVEWLAIVKASHFLVSDSCGKVDMPFETPRVDAPQLDWVRHRLEARTLPAGPWVIPDNFAETAPAQSALRNDLQHKPQMRLLPNPQTDELLSLLGLDHVVTVPCSGRVQGMGSRGGKRRDQWEASAREYPSLLELSNGGSAGFGEGSDPNEIQLDEV